MTNPMPAKDFIDYLKGLTAENSHGLVYFLTAKWCYENCPTETKRDEDFKRTFMMFMEIFNAMNSAHLAIGHFPYGSLRYEVGHEMELAIIRCFGGAVADALNEGGR